MVGRLAARPTESRKGILGLTNQCVIYRPAFLTRILVRGSYEVRRREVTDVGLKTLENAGSRGDKRASLRLVLVADREELFVVENPMQALGTRNTSLPLAAEDLAVMLTFRGSGRLVPAQRLPFRGLEPGAAAGAREPDGHEPAHHEGDGDDDDVDGHIRLLACLHPVEGPDVAGQAATASDWRQFLRPSRHHRAPGRARDFVPERFAERAVRKV